MVKPAAGPHPYTVPVDDADLPSACLAALADLSTLLRGRFVTTGEQYGIPSLAAFRLIVRLGAAPTPLPPSALAAEMHLTRGALTQMLQTLERRGLVRREPDPADRRISAATLTDKGRQSLEAFGPATREKEIEICAVLDAGTQRVLLDTLTRLQGHVLGMTPSSGPS